MRTAARSSKGAASLSEPGRRPSSRHLLYGSGMTQPTDDFEVRARDLLRDAPLIDGHNDLAYALRGRVGLHTSEVDLRENVPDLDTDIPRLRAGGVGGQFWSVW